MATESWKQGTKISGLILGILIVVGLLFGGFGGSDPSDAHTGVDLGAYDPADNPDAETVPLGDIGPGACWPERSFMSSDGPQLAANWLRDHKPEMLRLDRWLESHRGYYLPRQVVSDWDDRQGDRAADYVEQLVAQPLAQPITVLNHYCKGPDVREVGIQTFPTNEWIFFVPGHEQGSKFDLRPAFKAACGNPLLPPLKRPPKREKPPQHECQVNCQPPPGCEHNCNPCQQNCNPCQVDCNPCQHDCNELPPKNDDGCLGSCSQTQDQGHGVPDEPAVAGENENPNPETGCQGVCDGGGTEPSPPTSAPPPSDDTDDPGTSPGDGGTADGNPGPG